MADGIDQSRSQPSYMRTLLWLAIFVAAAFTLRSVFNINEGFDPESQRHLFTGNDPYYHHRTVTYVVENGQNLNFDPMINYPEGNFNPNPPLWTWTSAPLAQGLNALHVVDPVGTAINIMVAVWGALCVIPVYMIAKDLWGRRAGLWAGFFMAISAPVIQKSFWGYADHDAISMFFILLAIAFLVRGFRQAGNDIYVSKWGNSAAVSSGLRNAFQANRNTFVYAALAGIALTACAVTWKGYPYALAIIAVACVLQLVLDHLRNRDSTVTWLAYLITTAIAAILPWLLYYHAAGYHFATTVQPSLFVLGGVFAVGLVLVPTRNLPSVLVFPALAIAGVIGYYAFVQFAPSVAHTVFSGLGYFNQSKLYSTIAEAKRPSIGEVAANLGFFSFLAAFWGLAHIFRRAYKGQPGFVLVAGWSAVSIFLMFSASRFIQNAAPVFCVLLGFVLVKLMDLAKTSEIRKKFRSQHGQNIASRSLRSLSWRPVILVLLTTLLFIIPNLWIGADAGMGFEFKRDHGLLDTSENCERISPGDCGVHWGGFGMQYELKSNGWLPLMNYFATLDTNKSEIDRPAFMAWWDYGHWATGIGKHPTVADPFQSHYEMSGRFLASDSEAEAIDYLTILLITGDWKGTHYSPALDQLLASKYPSLVSMQGGYWYEPKIKMVKDLNLTEEKAFELYEDVAKATGHFVGYIGVDDKMGPFPTSKTAARDNSIFYAPVFLSNKNPDDYYQTKLHVGTGQEFRVQTYIPDPRGGYQQIGDGNERYFDANNQQYELFQGKLYPLGGTPLQQPGAQGVDTQGAFYFYEPTDLYGKTMFARAFGGTAADLAPAGAGLNHWRVIKEVTSGGFQLAGKTTRARQTALLQYYHGVNVSGRVLDDGGAPMAGVTVAFVDAYGAQHGESVSNAAGEFHSTAPFSENGDLRVAIVSIEGETSTLLYQNNGPDYQYSMADAQNGRVVSDVVLHVPRGTIAGHVYAETSGDSTFTPGKDHVVEGAQISVPVPAGAAMQATSTAGGNYTVGPLQAGAYTVSVTATGYNPGTGSANVISNGTVVVDVALTAKQSTVHATFLNLDGTPLANVPMSVNRTGDAKALDYTTNATGVVTFSAGEGHVVLDVNYPHKDANDVDVTYLGHKEFDVAFGGDDVNVIVQRTA